MRARAHACVLQQPGTAMAAAEPHELASPQLLCSSRTPNLLAIPTTPAPAAPRGAPATLWPQGAGAVPHMTGTWGDMLHLGS